MNVKLEAALAYGRMGWRIFPCHSIVNGACSCGGERDKNRKVIGPCKSPGKHPRTKRGLREATNDEATIRRWWGRWPTANIALATGSGIAVFDIDGEAGVQEFKALVAAHGAVPATLTAQTGRGMHIIYATRPGAGEVRSSARGNVHVRGEGGYIILPPSDHISGRKYQWVNKVAISTLPDFLRQWSQGYEVTNSRRVGTLSAGTATQKAGFEALGPVPTYLQIRQPIQPDVSKSASDALRTVWSPAEQARLISALQAIPANQYESWYQIGMVLHGLGWDRSDGTSIAFDLWDQWSQTCPEKYALSACEAKWQSFSRSARGELTLGTIYHLAKQMGWNGGLPPITNGNHSGSIAGPTHLNGRANGVNGHHALPEAFGGQQPIFFPDLNEDKQPKATCTNAGVAVTALGIACRKDLFHEKMLVAGQPIDAWAGDMSDDVIQMIRKTIRHRFGFDPKMENVRDACVQLCLEHQFDPVLDYLDTLQWDGHPRLDTWLQAYMGAPDTELNRTIGRLALVACVRRARQPGAKFDQIVVFESKEGRGKSSAIEILAGSENFSDQGILGRQDKEQQEAMCGIWLYEIADLTGMKKADIEHVKAFASRKVDRARPAYGRFRVDRPRRTVFFATTNDDEYLKSQTGNRRFWPVTVGHIDLQQLSRDRDQLWAEAAALEAQGRSLELPRALWIRAAEEQHQRTESDAWAEPIGNYLALKDRVDISIMDVLCDNQFLRLEAGHVGQREQNRAASVLRGLGWIRFQKRLPDGERKWRYRRAD